MKYLGLCLACNKHSKVSAVLLFYTLHNSVSRSYFHFTNQETRIVNFSNSLEGIQLKWKETTCELSSS